MKMIKYFNIEFFDFTFNGIMNTLEMNEVETHECLAHDDYDRKTKSLIDMATAQNMIESDKNPLNKIIKSIMILENGGLDVLEWFAAGAWKETNLHKNFNENYVHPRNQILK